MKYSLNTTFDELASEAGPGNVARTAHAMGISKRDPEGNKTLVGPNGTTTFGIGIGDYPVSPLDQATGFATLADNGLRNHPYLVQQATSSSGAVVYTHHTQPVQAIDPRVANDVTLTLEPVASWSGDALAGGRQSAAKTGTEGLGPNTSNNSDAWMVGYTPQVSAAVWVGSGYNEPIFNSAGAPLYGADLPGQTWQRFMDLYLAGKPQLKLAAHQEVFPNGRRPAPKPTTVAPTTSAPTTHSPSPTFSITTGFSSSSPTPSPTPTTHSPSPSPTPTTHSPSPTSTCGGLLQPPCSSSPASSSSPHASG
jgi:membrane peptidoglycan carboxypeptidase